jgi:HD domain/FecR protein
MAPPFLRTRIQPSPMDRTAELGTARRQVRWPSKPVQSAVLRALILVLPLAAGVAAAAIVSWMLPRPHGLLLVGWWLVVLIASLVAVSLVDRAARRLLPLALLLKLTLIFPDRAPSRFAVARMASNPRTLQQLAQRAQDGVDGDFARAAPFILALVTALSAHDRRTRGHSERVRVFTDLLAGALRLPEASRDRMRWVGLLHDIGKLEVSEDILNKPSKPDPPEWESLKRHPQAGTRLAAPLLPWLGEWGLGIEQHHERFDGHGYPRRLAAQDISLAGRILTVADSFDAMTAGTPYQRPITVLAARQELVDCTGSQFDPHMVRAFLNISLGKLRRTVGLVSWIAHLPFVSPRVIASRDGRVRSGSKQIAGVAVATVTAVVLSAAPAAAQGFATLHLLTGHSAIRPDGEASFRPGTEGAILHVGDTLRTSASGRAQITYFDESVTRLDWNTAFHLRELDPGEEGRRRRLLGAHGIGRTFSRVVSGPPGWFEIVTPRAIARVRGTAFFTEVRGDGAEAFGVVHGDLVVLLKGGEQMVSLRPGRYVEVSPDGHLKAAQNLPRWQLESDWLVYNLCVLDHDPMCPRSPAGDKIEQESPKPSDAPSSRGASAGPAPSSGTRPKNLPPPESPPGEPPPAEEACDVQGQGHGHADPCNAPGHGGTPSGQDKKTKAGA